MIQNHKFNPRLPGQVEIRLQERHQAPAVWPFLEWI